VYNESVGNINRAGAVNVIYGSVCQLQPDPTCSNPDDQFWTQNSPGVSGEGAEAADLFGHTLASGDFNGDGFADLAVGAYGEDVGSIVDAGAVNVIYGSAAGLQATGTGGPDDQYWTQDSPGLNSDGAEAGDQFGHALVAADFNGDGFMDLAVGASGEDVGTIVDAGAVSVLYGSSAGLQADAPDDQWWTQDSPGVQDQAEKGDAVGESLGAGDFNGDGFADLVMSVFLEGLPGAYQAGAVNVIYGSSCGLQADPTCGNPDDQFFTQGSGGVKDQAEANDWFGRSPAAGDFNGDGFDDLAIGAEKEDVGTATDAGSVNVIYGSSCGLQPDPTCGNLDDQFFTQGSDGVQDQAETGDFLGRGARAGDFNADGYADLAVSAFREDLGTVTDAGAVNVIYGSACGLQPDPTCGNPDDQFWNQDSPGVQDQAEAGDELGKNLGPVMDFNGDGFADLSIGVHQEDLGLTTNAGIAQVLYGSAFGIQATSPDDQKFAQGHGGVQDRAEKWDRFGWFG
jgi:predicted metal-binding protein